MRCGVARVAGNGQEESHLTGSRAQLDPVRHCRSIVDHFQGPDSGMAWHGMAYANTRP